MILDPKAEVETTERARKLFLSSLSYEQYVEYQKNEQITVTGSHGGEYVIKCTKGVRWRNIYKDDTRYCFGIKSGYQYPYFDVWLAQKLVIETDELYFLKNANVESEQDSNFQYREWLNSW